MTFALHEQRTARSTVVSAGSACLALLLCGCGDDGASAQNGDVRAASHGPVPNFLVRLVEGPSAHHVLCDARVRGITGTAPGYRASFTLTYPDTSVVTKNAVVSSGAPTVTDNTDGKLEAALVETPPGSGEYRVTASFKRPTTADVGAHQCVATIEELDGTGIPVAELLHERGWATSEATGAADPYLTATSHRQSGAYLSCASRLSFVDPAASYDIDITTSTALGDELRTVQTDATTPLLGIPTSNGGTLFVEWGTAPWSAAVPNLTVRFDFLGSVAPSECDIVVKNASSGVTVLSEKSKLSVGGDILLLQNDAYTSGPFTLNSSVGEGESLAARFTARKALYPFRVRKVRALCGAASGTESAVVALDIFRDNGGLNPGSIIYTSGATAYLFECPAGGAFIDVDLSSENIVVDSGTIRVSLYLAFVSGPVAFATDTDGIQLGRNLVMLSTGQWSLAENQGVTGDWILRTEIETL